MVRPITKDTVLCMSLAGRPSNVAIARLLADRKVPVDRTFAVLGSGGMAKAVVAALRDAGFHAGTVIARNPRTGVALADRYGYAWRAEVGSNRP
jgi:shikimate dehydrogenase